MVSTPLHGTATSWVQFWHPLNPVHALIFLTTGLGVNSGHLFVKPSGMVNISIVWCWLHSFYFLAYFCWFTSLVLLVKSKFLLWHLRSCVWHLLFLVDFVGDICIFRWLNPHHPIAYVMIVGLYFWIQNQGVDFFERGVNSPFRCFSKFGYPSLAFSSPFKNRIVHFGVPPFFFNHTYCIVNYVYIYISQNIPLHQLHPHFHILYC